MKEKIEKYPEHDAEPHGKKATISIKSSAGLPTDTAGPFDVRTDALIHVEAGQAIELFRQLLIIEAVRSGIPITFPKNFRFKWVFVGP